MTFFGKCLYRVSKALVFVLEPEQEALGGTGRTPGSGVIRRFPECQAVRNTTASIPNHMKWYWKYNLDAVFWIWRELQASHAMSSSVSQTYCLLCISTIPQRPVCWKFGPLLLSLGDSRTFRGGWGWKEVRSLDAGLGTLDTSCVSPCSCWPSDK